MNQTNDDLLTLQVDHQGSVYLSEAARWAKFLAIMGFVLCGFMILVAAFAGQIFSNAFRTMEEMGNASFNTMSFSIIYLVIAAIWFFPCLYLYRFSTKIQQGIRFNEQGALNQGFLNLKSCFRFIGIFTLIMLGLYAIVFVVILGAAI